MLLLTSFVLTTATLSFSGAPVAADTAEFDFADLAPSNSMLVVAIDDMNEMVARFEATPLSNLCEIEPIKRMIDNTIGSSLLEMREGLEDAGLDPDVAQRPDSLGFAVYVDLDEETGQSRSYILGYGDWGDNAEKAQEVFDFFFQRGREAGEIEMDSRNVRGREVTVITSIGEKDDFAGDFEGMDQMMMFGDPTTLLPNMDTLFMVRDGSRFLLANDMLAIDDALATFDGNGGETVKDTEDFQRINAMLGNADAYGIMRFEPLGELMGPMMMGPLGMVEPMIDELFGGIRGLGMSLSMANGQNAMGMAELRGAIYAPGEKSGLLSLFDESTPIDDSPPKMVPIDAISFSRINVAFKDVIPMVRDITAAMPMGGQEIENALDMYEPTVKPALDTLGSDVYVFATVRKPIEIDSASNVILVEAQDPDLVHPLLAMMGPSMGMEPRDFKGETIWSDAMGSMSLAVAGKWMLMGESRGVEQAIRAMGGGGESITDNPVFASSVRRMGDEKVVGWGWSDTVEQYALQREMLKNMNELLGGFDEFGPDDQIDTEQFNQIMEILQEVTPEDLARCVGPIVWSLTSPDDGWVQRVWMLPPTKQAG